MPNMRRLQLPGDVQPHVAFGRAVRARRDALGLSQEALAERCDLDRTYISGVERGRRNPTVQGVFRLALGLEAQPSELLRAVEEELGMVQR